MNAETKIGGARIEDQAKDNLRKEEVVRPGIMTIMTSRTKVQEMIEPSIIDQIEVLLTTIEKMTSDIITIDIVTIGRATRD